MAKHMAKQPQRTIVTPFGVPISMTGLIPLKLHLSDHCVEFMGQLVCFSQRYPLHVCSLILILQPASSSAIQRVRSFECHLMGLRLVWAGVWHLIRGSRPAEPSPTRSLYYIQCLTYLNQRTPSIITPLNPKARDILLMYQLKAGCARQQSCTQHRGT